MKNLNQKVFAVINKETKEIEMFGANAAVVKDEFDNYYADEAPLYSLEQTFMSQEEIKANM